MGLQLLVSLVVVVALLIHEYECQRFEEAADRVEVVYGRLFLESKDQDYPLDC